MIWEINICVIFSVYQCIDLAYLRTNMAIGALSVHCQFFCVLVWLIYLCIVSVY